MDPRLVTSIESGFFWLDDGLSQDLPHCRVMSFSYNGVIGTKDDLSTNATLLGQSIQSDIDRRRNVSICHNFTQLKLMEYAS